MSIQTELDRITNEVIAQGNMLDQAINALRDKAAGGGNIDSGILPAGYIPVPCIKFTGQQAVDTGIICNQDTEIRAVYTVDADGGMYIYGVTNDAQTASITAYRSANGGNWRFGSQRISLTTPVNEVMVWGIQHNKKRILRANVSSTYSTVTDFTAETTMVLGGRFYNNAVEEGTMLVGKVIAFDMYDDETLLLSFVPCINPEGECGFFDKVSQQFHGSATDVPLTWSFV